MPFVQLGDSIVHANDNVYIQVFTRLRLEDRN